jgi:AAA-like domain/TIR domain
MSTQPDNYTYDVFISYSPTDQGWVHRYLLPRLEQAKLKVCVPKDFVIGRPKLVNIEESVARSRKILLVLTPHWLNSGWSQFEQLLMQSDDPYGLHARVLPLLVEPCELPPRIKMLTLADFTNRDTIEQELDRLLRGLVDKARMFIKARVFISYKRKAAPDEQLAERLHAAFFQAGHHVFIDKTMKVGMEWAREIDRQIDDSDFLVVLLSEASTQSEMVAKEVEHAHERHQHTHKSRLLPVRVNYQAALPYQLSHYLSHIQQAIWQSDADTEGLILQLLDAVGHFTMLPDAPTLLSPTMANFTLPQPAADLRFIESLREPGGATRLSSEFYIQREGDERLHRELSKPYGTTTTIRAPRQTGKSSLLIRGVAQAQAQESKVVTLDLQLVDNARLQSLDSFLHYFGTAIFSKLRIDTAVIEKSWQSALGAPDKMTYLVEDYVLAKTDTKIILALDEADRLLRTTFHDNFFGLLRFWHNNRATNELWNKLDILMVVSTEPHLLIQDVTQSPFNVGLKIALQDFDLAQVAELNTRYHQPLNEQGVADVMGFLSGHPFLTRKTMYLMVTEGLAWQRLKQSATSQQSAFGDHLRRYLWLLRDQPELRDALKHVIKHARCPDEMLFYRLAQAGLVKGADSDECMCRCPLYERYFKDKL